MTGLAGTAALVRFTVRRDRLRIAVWVLSLVALVWVTGTSVKGFYPTAEDLRKAAAASEGNAAALAFNGPAQALDTLGGQVAFQVGAFGLVMVGLMSLLMTGRLTRGDEEAGRLELIRSLPVGRGAPRAAALVAVAAMDVAVGALVALSLAGLGLPVAGSVAFGVSYTLFGLCFTGVTLVAAQVTENTRAAYGLAGAVLGVAFVVRAAGDVSGGGLSWLSPIGWAQKARPFAGERWWPFLLLVAATAGLVRLAAVMGDARDVGGGLVAPRRGPRTGSRRLATPLALAARLQRGSLVGWSAGALVAAVAYGSIADSVEDFIADNEQLTEMLARLQGVDLVDSYLATSFRVLALIGAGFAISAALRARSEESAGLAEPVLATPVSRAGFAASHLAMALIGAFLVLTVSGLGVGLSVAAVRGDLSVVPELLVGSLIYLPAVAVLVGVTSLLVGMVPRMSGAAWAVLVGCFVVGLMGDLLGLPGWARDLSPFEHIPEFPARNITVPPLLLLSAVAVGLIVVGLAGFRRRGVG